MEYYTVLTAATLIIGLLAIVLFKVRGDWGILIGIAALYYWSLYGAWYIVLDKSGGYSGKAYFYLESKMFPIALDENYLIALVLYAAFIIAVELTLIATLRAPTSRPVPRLMLRHEPILLLGFAAAIGSFLIMRQKLGIAYAINASAYRLTRSDPGQWFTLHQVLNRVALIPPAIGAAVLAAGKTSRYFVNQAPVYVWPAYVALIGGMCAFAFTLGNKNEVFTALIAGFLAYAASAERPRWFRAACGMSFGMWFLYTIDLFRGVALSGLWEAVKEQIGHADEVGKFVSSSNEAFAAHFSMYGVLARRNAGQFRLQPVCVRMFAGAARVLARPASRHLSVLQRKRRHHSKSGLLPTSGHRLVFELRLCRRDSGRHRHGPHLGEMPECLRSSGRTRGLADAPVRDRCAMDLRCESASGDSRGPRRLQRLRRRWSSDSRRSAGLRLPAAASQA